MPERTHRTMLVWLIIVLLSGMFLMPLYLAAASFVLLSGQGVTQVSDDWLNWHISLTSLEWVDWTMIAVLIVLGFAFCVLFVCVLRVRFNDSLDWLLWRVGVLTTAPRRAKDYFHPLELDDYAKLIDNREEEMEIESALRSAWVLTHESRRHLHRIGLNLAELGVAGDASTVEEAVTAMRTEINNLNEFLESLASWSDPERRCLDRPSLNMREILEAVSGAIRGALPASRQQSFQMTINGLKDPPKVQGLRPVVAAIIANLLENAFKYSVGNVTLEMEWPVVADRVEQLVSNLRDRHERLPKAKRRVPAAWVLVRVRDHGDSLSEDRLTELFKVRKQDNSRRLGLPLSRVFARSFGGELTYQDRNSSAETKAFVLALPLSDPNTIGDEVPETAAVPAAESAPLEEKPSNPFQFWPWIWVRNRFRAFKAAMDISPRVLVPLCLIRATIGFTLGLYCYIYGALIFGGLGSHGETTITLWGVTLAPLRWAALVSISGLLIMAVLEIPTGVLADHLGRKKTIIASLFLRGLYFFFLLRVWQAAFPPADATSIVENAVVAMAVFGLQYTLMSGALIAWVSDALDEEGKANALTRVNSFSYNWFWSLFVGGAAAGMYFYARERGHYAFVLGLGLSLACGVICALYIRENRRHHFARIGDFFTALRQKVWPETRAIWREGWKIFKADRRLWVIAGTAAAVMALVNLVDYVWLIFAETRFDLQSNQFDWKWLALTLTFTLAPFLGNLPLSLWLERRRQKRGEMDPQSLARLNFKFNFLFAAPIFLAVVLAWFNMFDLWIGIWLFMFLMAWNKILEGALQGPLESVQNVLIPEGTRSRATVLSIEAVFQHLVAAFIEFFGAGATAGALYWWLLPASSVVVFSLILYFVIIRTTAYGVARESTAVT